MKIKLIVIVLLIMVTTAVPSLQQDDDNDNESIENLLTKSPCSIGKMFVDQFWSKFKNSSNQKNQKSIAHCSDFPGLKRMLVGVDITKLDLVPPTLQSIMGFRRPLFNINCRGSRTFENYSVPVEVELVDRINMGTSQGIVNNRVIIYRNLKEYRAEESFHLFPKVDYLPGAFSASGSYLITRKAILKHRQGVAVFREAVTNYRIQWRDSSQLDLRSDFLYRVNNLPLTYAENVDAYSDFIADYGTHYFWTGLFGGLLYQKSLLYPELGIKNLTDKQISSIIKELLYETIGQNGSPVDQTIQAQVVQNSETIAKVYGGYASYPPPNGFSDWSANLDISPWLLGGEVRPIEQLVANDTIRSELKKAIKFYRLQAYFDDYIDSYVMCHGVEDHSSNASTHEQDMKQIQNVLFSVDQYDQLEIISNKITVLFQQLFNSVQCQALV